MSVLKQRAVLHDSEGPVAGAIPNSLSVAIDQGWSWAAAFNRDYDERHAKERAFTITVIDDVNTPLTTPVLVAGPRNTTDSKSTSGSGMGGCSGWDRSSQRMRLNNQSFPTWSNTDTPTLVAALASHAGVSITNVPDWHVHEEDVKQAKLSDFVFRLLKLAGCDLVAKLDGTLDCVAWENDSAGDLVIPWSKLESSYNPWDIRTGLRVGKLSTMPSGEEIDNTYDFYESGAPNVALNTPVYGPGAANLSSHEGLGAVTFLSEDDEIVTFVSFKPSLYQYSGPQNISLLATKMTVVVDPIFGSVTSNFPTPARVVVSGTPEGTVPEGVDREFLNPTPTSGAVDTSLGDNPASEEYIDSLWPSETVAVDRRPYCLAKLNGPADALMMTRDILDTRPRLKQQFTYSGRLYQVVAINWDLVGCNTQVTLWRV